jgi:hypothetical protein
MDKAGKFVNQATCTTCQFSEDFSNYWTAVMYFRAANGTYKRVPQRSNTGFDGTNGGMTVYYMQDPIMNFQQTSKVTAFRPVRVQRMIEIVLIRLGISHDYRQSQCQHEGRIKEHGPGYLYLLGDLDDSVTHDQGLSKDTMQGRNYGQSFLPNVGTTGSQQPANVESCWDGKNLDPPDHKSHMAYATGANGISRGSGATKCPASHPVRVPQLMLETIWDTRGFNDKSKWPKDVAQPFVWSYGDK